MRTPTIYQLDKLIGLYKRALSYEWTPKDRHEYITLNHLENGLCIALVRRLGCELGAFGPWFRSHGINTQSFQWPTYTQTHDADTLKPRLLWLQTRRKEMFEVAKAEAEAEFIVKAWKRERQYSEKAKPLCKIHRGPFCVTIDVDGRKIRHTGNVPKLLDAIMDTNEDLHKRLGYRVERTRSIKNY